MTQYGLTMRNDRPDAEVDVVFVHGLRGNRLATWTKNQVFWPEGLLVKDSEKCRIISFGYDSGIAHRDTAEITQGSIESDAKALCSQLHAARVADGTEERPIITVAHSLGGLVCAQVVVSGEKSDAGDSVSNISKHMKGMVFLGTPFGGATTAGWGELVRRVFDVVRRDTDQQTLRTLTPDANELKDLRKSFPDIIRKRRGKPEAIGVVFFYERLKTFGVQVVAEDSASYPGVGEILPMRTNHLDICKFDSAQDDHYKVVRDKILALIKGETVLQDKSFGDKYMVTVNGDVVNLVSGGHQSITTQNITYQRN